MLLRLAYLAVTNTLSLIRLLPMSDREKEIEIVVLRHQLAVLQRPSAKPVFTQGDRFLLGGLLHRLPVERLRRLQLLVRPDTILRWHRDLLKRRHTASCVPRRCGRPRTVRSTRALALRLARENPTWGDRKVHGELAALGIQVAASTVWEIFKECGIDPAPERAHTIWAAFLRGQAEAILACDFLETRTLTGTRLYVFAVIEHATRRIRILGATAHPTAAWVVQLVRHVGPQVPQRGRRGANVLVHQADRSTGRLRPPCTTRSRQAGVSDVCRCRPSRWSCAGPVANDPASPADSATAKGPGRCAVLVRRRARAAPARQQVATSCANSAGPGGAGCCNRISLPHGELRLEDGKCSRSGRHSAPRGPGVPASPERVPERTDEP